jgi:NADPH2:quinone reductase
MRAVLSQNPGPPGSLALLEVPDPVPGPAQVLIEVRACGVNYPDLLVIEDKYQFKPPRPFSPGIEVAGVIVRIGSQVTTLRAGQRVMAQLSHGGMAQLAVAEAKLVTPVPEEMPLEDAAVLLTTYGTSLYALRDRGHLRAGETLLVLGAGGGVGLAAVQLGKALGARVVAAASSQAKIDVAMAHGADQGVIYPKGPFDKESAKALAQLFKDACGSGGWDVAYDAIGGDYSEAAIRASGWAGRFLVIGFPAGIARIPLNLVLLKSCDLVGVFWGAATARDEGLRAALARELLELHSGRRIRPYISARYPLERAGEALAALRDRSAQGKLIVVPG